MTKFLQFMQSNTETKRCRSAAASADLSPKGRLTFSSMTCLRVESARVSASLKLRSGLYSSSRVVCAPSLPDPIAMAVQLLKVPLGSVWYSSGPADSSHPAISSATPKGRLCNHARLSCTEDHSLIQPGSEVFARYERALYSACECQLIEAECKVGFPLIQNGRENTVRKDQ